MNKLRLIPLLLFACLCSTTAFAQSDADQNSLKMQRLMSNFLYEIEQATGLEHRASTAIKSLDERGRQVIFDSISDKTGFSNAAQGAMQQIISGPVQTIDEPSKMALASSPYTPDYPITAAYVFAEALGLTNSPDQRCGGDALENYRSVLTGFEEGFYAAEALCVVGGCDPTGIVCAAACIPFETVGVALHYAKLPIAACDVHEGNVNAAEIEAGFENTVSLLMDLGDLETDLQNHDTRLINHNNMLVYHDDRLSNHDSRLSAHDTHLSAHDNHLAEHDNHLSTHDYNLSVHDTDIKALLSGVLGNQEEIIKLLKTPQGKRPGWRKQGY